MFCLASARHEGEEKRGRVGDGGVRVGKGKTLLPSYGEHFPKPMRALPGSAD